ncbi:hypothetical protein, partial [Streptomyces sp. NPDC012825]|uniref:hypothetical protein n=1 Tax=Streptomyces sp. NPDC012825 TaxID=3364851 RepID=UPI003684C5F3
NPQDNANQPTNRTHPSGQRNENHTGQERENSHAAHERASERAGERALNPDSESGTGEVAGGGHEGLGGACGVLPEARRVGFRSAAQGVGGLRGASAADARAGTRIATKTRGVSITVRVACSSVPTGNQTTRIITTNVSTKPASLTTAEPPTTTH